MNPFFLLRKQTALPVFFLICLCVFWMSSARAETISWDGSGSLQQDPWGDSALFPSSLSGNTVTVTGDVAGFVYGGLSDIQGGDAAATGNSVSVGNGAVVDYSVIGGEADSDSGAATATGNSVSVSGGATVDWDVFGGAAYSDSGAAAATGNSVSVSDQATVDYVSGGEAASDSGAATATGNSVSVSDSDTGSVRGGVAYSDSGAATATGNSVSVSDSDTGSVRGGRAESNSGAATATGNSVSIIDSVVGGYVYGGDADSDSGAATASGNSVSVSNGARVDYDVYGGYAYSYSDAATATGNRVSLIDSVVGGDVYGGYADSDGSGTSGEADNNTILIRDGSIGGDIYGGYSLVDMGVETGSATGNTITISGAPTLVGSDLYGGFVGDYLGPAPGTDAFTGNTLNVWGYTGSTVGDVGNFQFYDFLLPDSLANGGTALESTGTVTLGDGAGRSSTVRASTLGGKSPLAVGDSITLIQANVLDVTDFTQTSAGGRHGAVLLYDWSLSTAGSGLTGTVDSIRVNPQAKALSEGFLAGAALVNQGGDLAADKGIAFAVSSARAAHGLASFSAVGGGKSRYDTGSHVDVEGLSFLTGLSWGLDLNPGRLTLGAFFEGGAGDYDSHNSFSNTASVKGSGDTDYLGGGILGRFDFSDTGSGHFYAEASGRMGRVESDFSSGDLRDTFGVKADYDTDSLYYGVHLGAGYVWSISDSATLDLYGKYLWTRREGDSVTLPTGDPVKFDDVDSHRLRGGARLAYAVNDWFRPYIGAAYEHEFDGEAEASTYGYSIPSPDLKGGTGIGEIGLTFLSSAGISVDLGVQGYTGIREGVSGTLQLKFEF
jgi:hypothetical protein